MRASSMPTGTAKQASVFTQLVHKCVNKTKLICSIHNHYISLQAIFAHVIYYNWGHDGHLRKAEVHQIIQSYQRSAGTSMVRGFSVNYKRHVLTMDDLSTLYGQNWLNDQV